MVGRTIRLVFAALKTRRGLDYSLEQGMRVVFMEEFINWEG